MIRRDNGLVRWHPAGAPIVAGGCCCDDCPTGCPCGTWPPEEWPCGGLVEEYTIMEYSFEITSYFSKTDCTGSSQWTEFELLGPVVMTASPTVPCQWVGNAAWRFRESPGGTWVNRPADDIFLHGLGGTISGVAVKYAWRIDGPVFEDAGALGALQNGMYKICGRTPLGAYIEPQNCTVDGFGGSYILIGQAVIE